MGGLHQGDDHEVNRHYMAGIAEDRPGMEDLMEAVDHGPGVRLPQAVDDGSQDVAGAAGDDQPDDGWTRVRRPPEEVQEPHSGDPEDDVDDGVKPAGGR